MTNYQLDNHVEALIFCSQDPIGAAEICECLSVFFNSDIKRVDVDRSIETIKQKYESENYVFEILEIAGGYRFFSKPAYSATIQVLIKERAGKRLSASTLETLSIIAYKQPVNKSEIEQIRGVSSDYALQRLLEKELICILGKSESIGRPLLYGTSMRFMDYFGLKSVQDLPQLKDITRAEQDIKVSILSE